MHPQPGDNSKNIQAAIEAAAGADCADVVLAAGAFDIDSPIQLRTGVRLSGQRYRHSFSTIRPSEQFKGDALLVTRFVPGSKERKQTDFIVQNIRLDAFDSCAPGRPQSCQARVSVGLWLVNPSYPTIRECEFSGFPADGAGIRGTGVLYLKVLDSRFLSILGWGIDLSLQYSPRVGPTNRPSTYYAVSVGAIERNYFSSRRGIRVGPTFGLTIRDNQFEGGLSMIHAYEAASAGLAIEDNYFELKPTPQDIPDRGTIVVRGTGRIVGNLVYGPPKGKLPSYHGPGIEISGSPSFTLQDNLIRCFDPAVRARGITEPSGVHDLGNVIQPKAHVKVPWDMAQGASTAQPNAAEPEQPPELSDPTPDAAP